jgi:hypothetical protein
MFNQSLQQPLASQTSSAPAVAPGQQAEYKRRSVNSGLWIGPLITCVFAGTVFWHWLTPEPLMSSRRPLMPQPLIANGTVSLMTPGYQVTAELAAYQDELFAYLMFDHLRHTPRLGTTRLLLTFDKRKNRPYSLLLCGPADLLRAIPEVTSFMSAAPQPRSTWALTALTRIEGFEQQTRLFVSAYNLPVRRKLEELPRAALSNYLQRFIQFKSRTDRRIRLRLEPVPRPLSGDEAGRLAGDILEIAEFYSIPIELFLGIGAMENNYMNVRGDLRHSIWKRRPAPDDVVLERRSGRVRVLNDSVGVWQITRETLRYAHQLVRKDKRDYSSLPQHLRPPLELKVDEVDPAVLTTYAGVLLRDLLDRFNGDVTLAVSAYNGGPARPNLRYGTGVLTAAQHARRVVEQAAALNGETVVRMKWLRSP